MTTVQQAFLGSFEKELIAEIEEVSVVKQFKAGEIIMDIGQYIKAMPLVLDGVIKIIREDKKEGELLLYFLEKGDTCALSIACCIGTKKSEIRAIADVHTTVAMIPNQYLDSWMGTYKTWRNYVLESYSNRLNELLSTVDNIAFSQMDVRIMNYLKEKASIRNSQKIEITHQVIANDLNTSRVVVSRILKSLENQGKILLQRNNINLL
ncbi:helix-turn-helix domain-containing protein [Sphingobacterium faecium]|uniref:Crp/Fnr family transcriptional regulator n=1 Tax=Sphingobacterium faecium TaxID=34087 RepID=UPI00129218E7|nr:Crp/Fnr family transcriptional regulator [Sphingobacterium faecium]MQP26121.1 helix-turn-helix domain-containing protein [Sphingobacterium faecium]